MFENEYIDFFVLNTMYFVVSESLVNVRLVNFELHLFLVRIF